MIIEVLLADPGLPIVAISVHEGDDLTQYWTGTVVSPTSPIVGEHLARAQTDPVNGMRSFIGFHGTDVIGSPFR